MVQLILKDFRVHALLVVICLAALFAASTLYIALVLLSGNGFKTELMLYTLITILSSSAVSLLFFIQDEMFKTDAVFVSLPVSRKQLVWSKYISSIVLLLLAFTAHFFGFQLGVVINNGVGFEGAVVYEGPLLWCMLLLAVVAFKSYAFPLYFKFGMATGGMVFSVFQLLVVIAFLYSLQFETWTDQINAVVVWAEQRSLGGLFGMLLCLVVLLTSGSMPLSAQLFKNKNLGT